MAVFPPNNDDGSRYADWESSRGVIDGLNSSYDPPDRVPAFSNVEAVLAWSCFLRNPPVYGGNTEFGPHAPEGLPLEEVSLEKMFDDAHALSGHTWASIEGIFSVLEKVWWESDDHIDVFTAGTTHMLSEWHGTAADDVALYVGEFKGYVTNRQQTLMKAAKCVLSYAAIIAAARRNMNDLMDTFTQALDKRFHASPISGAPGFSFGLAAFTSIASMVATAFTGGLTMTAFVTTMAGITSNGIGTANTLNVGGSHYHDIVNSYLSGTRRILTDAAKEIERTVLPDLRNSLAHLPKAPSLPQEVRDIEKNPPSFSPDAAVGPNSLTQKPVDTTSDVTDDTTSISSRLTGPT